MGSTKNEELSIELLCEVLDACVAYNDSAQVDDDH